MRVHYILNDGAAPEAKLADVQLSIEAGIRAGPKLVACSVWRSKKGEGPAILVPSRSYATAGGIRYYELLRSSEEGGTAEDARGKIAVRNFRQDIRDE